MKEKLEGIVLDNLITEELVMTLGIIGSETELLVIGTDDMGKVWRHS